MWGCKSVEDCLSSMHEVLGSTPSLVAEKEQKTIHQQQKHLFPRVSGERDEQARQNISGQETILYKGGSITIHLSKPQNTTPRINLIVNYGLRMITHRCSLLTTSKAFYQCGM